MTRELHIGLLPEIRHPLEELRWRRYMRRVHGTARGFLAKSWWMWWR